MNPSTTVLFNSPALNALHRKQLMSLCKRFHIKASGKNADLVAKLQAFAKTLPEAAAADIPDSSMATQLAGDLTSYHPSSDNSETASWSPFKRLNIASDRAMESQPILQEKDEEEVGTQSEIDSWRNVENEGAALTPEVEVKKPQTKTSLLSQQTTKIFKSFLCSPTKWSQMNAIEPAAEPPSPSSALSLPEPGMSRTTCLSLSEDEPTDRIVSIKPSTEFEMDGGESEVTAAISPKRQTVRIPSTAFAASPYKRLPNAASFSTKSPIPGTFPFSNTQDIQTASFDQSSSSSSAFVFGSPRHSVKNHAFVTPILNVATSQTPLTSDAGVSAKLAPIPVGLSMREIMEAELKKRVEEKASKGELVRGPGLLSSLAGISSIGHTDGKKRRFDDAHEKEFAKMTSIADHYAARRPGQPSTLLSTSSTATLQKKSTSQRRFSSTNYRPSLIVNSNGGTYRPKTTLESSAEDDSGRAVKKTRFSVLEPVQVPNSDVSSQTSTTAIQHEESSKKEPADKSEVEADAQRERERTKRKLAIAKARRSSLAVERGGRFGLSSTPKTLPPKADISRSEFVRTGMNTIKKGVSSSTEKAPNSTFSTSFPLQLSAERMSDTAEKGFQTLSSSTKPTSSSSTAALKIASATLPSRISPNVSRAPIPTFNASSRSSSIRSGLAVSSNSRVPSGTPSISRTTSRLFAPTASSLARQAGVKTSSTALPSSSSSSSLVAKPRDSADISSKRPTIPTMKRSQSGLLPQSQVQAQGKTPPAADDSTLRPTSLYPTLPFNTASSTPGTFPSSSIPVGSESTSLIGFSNFGKSPSRIQLKARSTARLSILQPRLAGSTPIRKKRSTMSTQSVGKPIGLSHRTVISSSAGSSRRESGGGNGFTPLSARMRAGRKSRSSLSISVSAAKARSRIQARARGRASVPNVQMSTSDTSMDTSETGGRTGRLSCAGI